MTVSLEVNAIRYGGWESIRIERSIETLSGAFSLGISERWPGQSVPRGINPGDRCVVRIDNDVVVTGWVDDLEPGVDGESHDISVTGRDATGDLVDCSAIHKPSQWTGQKLERIAQELLAPFGLKVITQANTGEAFKKFAIEQGETVHEAITRMCKLRAVLAIADGQGNLVITTADAATRAATALEEGKNIKAIRGQFSHKERFSEIHVKGQTQGSDTESASVTTGWKGNAQDAEIKRYRPLLVMAEGQANTKQCQERAAWEKSTRAGKGHRATVTVTGWRQGEKSTSPLWDINTLVFVNSSTLKIRETLLVSGVIFTVEENGGHITELTLVRPEAFLLIREPERQV